MEHKNNKETIKKVIISNSQETLLNTAHKTVDGNSIQVTKNPKGSSFIKKKNIFYNLKNALNAHSVL